MLIQNITAPDWFRIVRLLHFLVKPRLNALHLQQHRAYLMRPHGQRKYCQAGLVENCSVTLLIIKTEFEY